jgi:mono/diheme cytochrome c family protein
VSRAVLVEALDVLIAEMPRAVEMATQEERAAVVAYLRGKFPEWPAGTNGFADEVERGEHRREGGE